jgi:hypothetical protein
VNAAGGTLGQHLDRSQSINSWSVDVPTSGGGGGGATLRAYRYYTAVIR